MRLSVNSEIGLSFRNAAKAVVLCENGCPVSHYIRFAGELAEIALEWPPFPMPTSRQALSLLIAHAVTNQTIQQRVGETPQLASFVQRDARFYGAVVEFLHRTHTPAKDPMRGSVPMPYSVFEGSCRLIVGEEVESLRQSECFTLANTYVADRLNQVGQLRRRELEQLVGESLAALEGRGYTRPTLTRLDAFDKLWKRCVPAI